jgi:SPP1 gp7 family putative phage head morphogenesis protein
LRVLEEKAMKQMQRAYTASFSSVLNELNRLEIQINKMIADGKPDLEIYQEMQSFYEKKLNAIENKIEAFNKDAIEITKDLQKDSVKVGTDYSKDNLQAALGKPPAGFTYEINVIDAGAMEQFVGFSSNGSPLNDLFQKIVVDYGADITNTLSDGILQGQNPLKIAREIKKYTGMPLYRANTIARTESHRAARAATIDNYGKNTDLISGYVRLATGDSRTCPACFALHGTVYELNQILPTHPNCRCIIVPKTKTWAEITGDDTIEDVSDKIPSAAQLFDRLSEKDKKRVLGPERYNLWKEGKPLDTFVGIKQDADWGPTTIIKPLRDIR